MLSQLEKNILKLIAQSHPYPFDEIEKIYKGVRSFDKLISIIEYARSRGMGAYHVYHQVEPLLRLQTK